MVDGGEAVITVAGCGAVFSIVLVLAYAGGVTLVHGVSVVEVVVVVSGIPGVYYCVSKETILRLNKNSKFFKYIIEDTHVRTHTIHMHTQTDTHRQTDTDTDTH